jgi:tetratricopeptide (TPR) repeat protein
MRLRAATLVVSVLLLAGPAFAQFASESQRLEALRYYRTGQQLMADEHFAEAAEAFQRATDHDRLLTLAYYGQGQAYMELRRFASAARMFSECREAFKTLHGLRETARQSVERQRDDELRELRDSVHRLATDRRRSRDVQITQLEARMDDLERHRTSPATFEPPAFVSLALGSAYFRNGQLEDAEREWKAAVAANSRFGEALNNLAALYAMTGRKQEAEDALRSAERAGFHVQPQLKADIRGL